MSDNRTALLVEMCRIMRDYGLDVDNAWDDKGRVAMPGKFQGEPVETLWFHSEWVNGNGEMLGEWAVMTVDETERQIFGFGPATTHVGIREDDTGFVFRCELTRQEYNQACDAAQADQEAEDYDPADDAC